jgi:sugar fermentation stimulation protein A
MLYLAQRQDAQRLAFARDIDRVYAAAVQSAVDIGVELLCYRCRVDVEGVSLADAIPVTLISSAPD